MDSGLLTIMEGCYWTFWSAAATRPRTDRNEILSPSTARKEREVKIATVCELRCTVCLSDRSRQTYPGGIPARCWHLGWNSMPL